MEMKSKQNTAWGCSPTNSYCLRHTFQFRCVFYFTVLKHSIDKEAGGKMDLNFTFLKSLIAELSIFYSLFFTLLISLLLYRGLLRLCKHMVYFMNMILCIRENYVRSHTGDAMLT